MSTEQPLLHVALCKALSAFTLDIRLDVGREIMVLFGPSGAGKTSVLNAIAGLLTPDEGEIRFDGTVFFRRRPGMPVVNVPARKRRVGYVFQQYALFPHMTALENVRFALRRQPDADRRAREWLERMHIAHLADRYPHQMSGGQQQRVAIARALAASPRLLLLDEPFSALDVAVRERLQADVKALQQELGLVVLYVTHRLEDAFAVGDRLAVIREGRVMQVGPIEDVVRRPSSLAVAESIGVRNLFRATVVRAEPAGILLDWDGLPLWAAPQPVPVHSRITAYVRPEDVKILYPDRPVAETVRFNQMEARIREVREGAHVRMVFVEVPNGHVLEIHFPHYAYTPLRLAPGEVIQIALRREGIILVPETMRA